MIQLRDLVIAVAVVMVVAVVTVVAIMILLGFLLTNRMEHLFLVLQLRLDPWARLLCLRMRL